MRILLYGINYYPEPIGIGKYSTEMCEWLASRGHIVEVITAMPSYPQWKIAIDYKGKWWHVEQIKGVQVKRCPLYIPARITGLSRIIFELSYALSSLVYWIASFFKKYDVVICVSPPIQIALISIFYKVFHRTLLINHIQDLQLDAAKQLGLIKNNIILKFMEIVENFILTQSHFVSTISEGMKRNILMKGILPEKIISLNNWIDTSSLIPTQAEQKVREMFGIHSTKKIVLYSGNIGEKQGLEILIPVAERLMNTSIFFLVIGEGAYKKRFEELIQMKGLQNIKLFPIQHQSLLNSVLNLADIHLVLQKRAAADLVMPSKLTAILSVGGLALVTTEVGSTLYDLIKENNIAVLVEPESPLALQKAIEENIENKSKIIRKNARDFAVANLEKENILSSFEFFLKNNLLPKT